MSKCAVKRKEYKKNDFTKWLKGEIYAKEVRQKDVAEVIGVSPSTFCMRMKNGEFLYGEILKIFEYFRTPDKDILRLMKL